MAITFRQVNSDPLQDFDATAPDGCVIGVIGEDGAGKRTLLRIASGALKPASGAVETPAGVRALGADDALNFAPAAALLIEHTLAKHDRLVRGRAAISLDRLRRAGTTVLLVSHDEELLQMLCDEIWWLDGGKLAGRGDPAEILSAFRSHVAARMRGWGEQVSVPLAPKVRRGDGRAALESIELLGENGRPTGVWRSGELATVRVTIRFAAAVSDPVAGILIRTRIGLNVYGTNTELEGLKLGPRAAGEKIRVSFGFRCELCPGDYTLTAASHDPDGVWHDWLEDAVAFHVTDARYTLGVANLRARASLEV